MSIKQMFFAKSVNKRSSSNGGNCKFNSDGQPTGRNLFSSHEFLVYLLIS